MKLKNIGKMIFATLIIPAAVYLFFLILRPSVFAKPSLIWTLFNQSIAYIIMAWGMSFEMTAGNMDLSVGAEMIFGTLVACQLASKLGIPGIVLGALAVALVIATIKSVLSTLINVNGLIISIAYTLIFGSLGYVYVKGQSVILTSENTLLGKFPYSLIILVISGIVIYVLDKYSVFGAHCRALGGNETLAKTAGIKKNVVNTKAIFICSIYAAIAAIISVSRCAGSAAQTGLLSMSVVFQAMTGVFIAMILTKYINMTVGIIVGVVSMNIITIGLIAIDMPSSMKDTVNGGFLLLLMIINFIINKREKDKLYRQASASRVAAEEKAAAETLA